MAKNRLCSDCTFNNNGWCNARKTNKGLKDLLECEFKKTDNLVRLEGYLEQKRFELQVDIEDAPYNRGIVKGLEIALKMLN